MKFDAHVSNVGFILYLVAQVIPITLEEYRKLHPGELR